MSRRKLLLCSAPAALALAALVWALVPDGRCVAERRAERVREGMTFEETREALGHAEIGIDPSRRTGGSPSPERMPIGSYVYLWNFPDGSIVAVQYRLEDGTIRVTRKGVLPPPPWRERLRGRLRGWGLPV
jgi:hypothetical protein